MTNKFKINFNLNFNKKDSHDFCSFGLVSLDGVIERLVFWRESARMG